MRKIHCYGHLAEIIPEPIELDVQTAGEAIRAISMQIPEFLKALEQGSYRVVRGDTENGFELALDDVNTFRLGHADLHIIPVVEGSKSAGGALKAILGTALVGAAVFMSGGTLAAPLMSTGILSGVTWGNIAIFGATMALMGVSQMLSAPELKSSDEGKEGSYAIQGPSNMYEQGNPVPLVYGEVITGGVLISGGVDIEDIPGG